MFDLDGDTITHNEIPVARLLPGVSEEIRKLICNQLVLEDRYDEGYDDGYDRGVDDANTDPRS